MKTISYLIKTFMVTLLILITLLVAVWLIPETTIVDHSEKGINLLKAEEGDLWEDHFTYTWGASIDNATDIIMMKQTISSAEDGHSLFYKVFYCNGYARYWHGYLIILRPLLALMSYVQIRYLFMVIHMFALVGTAIRILKKFNCNMVYGWVVSMIVVNFVSLPFSLQFSWVFFIMYGAIWYLDWNYDKWKMVNNNINLWAFFMVTGMVTSFMDLLTSPVLSLGMPLLYLLMLKIKLEGETQYKKNILTMICASSSWVIGYVGCWVMKWLLAIPILEKGIFLEAVAQVGLRTGGKIDFGAGKVLPSSFVKAVTYNVYALLPPGLPDDMSAPVWTLFFVFVLIGVIVLLLLFLRYHETLDVVQSYIPILILMCYPYVWYGFATQHSQIHPFLEYRNQMITVMGGWIVISNCIKWSRLKKRKEKELM